MSEESTLSKIKNGGKKMNKVLTPQSACQSAGVLFKNSGPTAKALAVGPLFFKGVLFLFMFICFNAILFLCFMLNLFL